MEWIIGWGLIWFVLAWVAVAVFPLLSGFLTTLVTSDEDAGLVALVVGWIFAAAFWVFAIIQVIIHIVHLIEYLQ